MLRKILIVCAAVVASGLTSAVHAQVTYGSSSASILSASLYIDERRDASIADLWNEAPSPYSSSVGPTGPTGISNPFLSLTADDLEASIFSDVDGAGGSRLTSGEVAATNLLFTMTDLLSFSTEDYAADASATGAFGSLIADRNASILGATLTVLGDNVTLDIGEVYNQNGLTITFLQGLELSGPGVAHAFSTLLFINFEDFAHDGEIYNGSVRLGHVEAFQLAAVPEPATALVLGALGLATALRRRRKN